MKLMGIRTVGRENPSRGRLLMHIESSARIIAQRGSYVLSKKKSCRILPCNDTHSGRLGFGRKVS